jgi:nucleotide-binding universal stress UspA family protein
MYNKMLVVLDGSKWAEVVFTYAQELAGRLNICLELLHVCTPQEEDQLPMRKAYIEHMAEVLQNKSDQVRSLSGEKSKCATVAQGHVVVGYPAEEILKYIDENKIDLLMLSTHGKSGIKRWNIGSVANQVIHAAKIPIWIVPSELKEADIYEMLPKRTIVIPLYGSKVTEVIIPYAVSMAKQRGTESEIVVIYVEDNSQNSYLNLAIINQNEDKRISIIKDYLDDVVKRIKDSGVAARSEILKGDPASAITNYSRANHPQLIAMATPRSGLSKVVFGSVTENVLQMIKKTPLLLVSPKE